LVTEIADDPAAGAAEARRLAASIPAEDIVARDILAHWAAYYGDPETALPLINAQRSLWRPVLSEVRKLPGFKDRVRNRDPGLVDYWREYGWSDFCRLVGENDFECE
jgi:hypothetical protein